MQRNCYVRLQKAATPLIEILYRVERDSQDKKLTAVTTFIHVTALYHNLSIYHTYQPPRYAKRFRDSIRFFYEFHS